MSKEGAERPDEAPARDVTVAAPQARPKPAGKAAPSSTGSARGRKARQPHGGAPRTPADQAALPRRRTGERVPRATQSYRFLRAYWTTFVVCMSYTWFSFIRRFFAASWAEAKIAELHVRNARRVQTTIVLLQGLFIKVGQLMSIMANFLPEQFRSGLEALQDQVPPRPYEEIAERIEEELGRPVSEIFARFSESPLASASLGQVHEAWLTDGTRVAVKVQHRDIDEIVRLDLLTIRRIMTIVTLFVPVQGVGAYYDQVRVMISEELDFLREARNIERIAANFASDLAVRFPTPLPALCTRRVIVTSFVDGVKVGDLAALERRKIDRKALARQIVQVFCQQIFVDGVYHADPHPGNMLVGDGGELVLLDFGAVAELSPEMRQGIPEFLEGVIRRDTDQLIKALRKMGFLARTDSAQVSEKVIEFFHQRFQDEVKLEGFNLKDIRLDPKKGIESFIDLRRMNISLKELSGAFHVPRDFVLLERTLLLLTGVCTQLDPELSPMDVIRPYLEDFVLGNRDWAQIALEAAKDMAVKAITIPDDLRKYLTRANRGESEIRVRGLEQAAGLIYTGVRQLIYASLAVAAGFGALELYLHDRLRPAQICLYGAGGAGVLLLGSLLFTRTK